MGWGGQLCSWGLNPGAPPPFHAWGGNFLFPSRTIRTSVPRQRRRPGAQRHLCPSLLTLSNCYCFSFCLDH